VSACGVWLSRVARCRCSTSSLPRRVALPHRCSRAQGRRAGDHRHERRGGLQQHADDRDADGALPHLGHCVIATAKAPLKGSASLVYGCDNAGHADRVIQDGRRCPPAVPIIRDLARSLSLAEHAVVGTRPRPRPRRRSSSSSCSAWCCQRASTRCAARAWRSGSTSRRWRRVPLVAAHRHRGSRGRR
jgi:hypothetical protein